VDVGFGSPRAVLSWRGWDTQFQRPSFFISFNHIAPLLQHSSLLHSIDNTYTMAPRKEKTEKVSGDAAADTILTYLRASSPVCKADKNEQD
jgi:hypothetical protein